MNVKNYIKKKNGPEIAGTRYKDTSYNTDYNIKKPHTNSLMLQAKDLDRDN